MALTLMRESLCMPASYYTDITESAPKEIKESLEKVAKARITESINPTLENVKSVLKESKFDDSIIQEVVNKLRETGINTTSHRIYKVPVAKINPPGTLNGNRRRYPESLWRNVMENQKDKWQGLCGLADHPTDDTDPGSIKNSSIVWLGMEIDPATNLVYGIGSFVGDYGHMFQEIIDCGGRVGFSSSGFGELMSDGETVNPDTYTIERLADVVLNPSQEVYGSFNNGVDLGNIEYSKQNVVHESTEPKSFILSAKTAKIKENTEKEVNEEKMAETTKSAFAKAEEKALRNHINSFLNENTNVSDPLQRMSDLNEILTIIKEGKLTDLEEDVVSKLTEMQVSLEKDIADAQALKEAMGDSDISSIQKNTEKLMEAGTLLADQVADYKTLCEGLTARNAELSKKLHTAEFRLNLKEKKEEKSSFSRNQEAVANAAHIDALIEEMADLKKSANTKIKSLTESINRYKAGNEKLAQKNDILSKKLEEANRVLSNSAKLKESKNAESKASMDELKKLREENETLKGMCERLQKRNAALKDDLIAVREDLNNLQNEYNEATTPNIHIEPKFEEKVSKYFNWRENQGIDIENFWADVSARYGESILPYEHKIRDAKTLSEAQQAFYKVMPLVDSDAKAAHDATFHEGGADKAKRMEILESTGMQIDDGNDIDRVNQQMAEKLARLGLQ